MLDNDQNVRAIVAVDISSSRCRRRTAPAGPPSSPAPMFVLTQYISNLSNSLLSNCRGLVLGFIEINFHVLTLVAIEILFEKNVWETLDEIYQMYMYPWNRRCICVIWEKRTEIGNEIIYMR